MVGGGGGGDFRAFLLARRADQESPLHSHTSIDHPKGRFVVPPEDAEAFYAKYAAALAGGDDRLHLTEKQEEWSPVRVDVDVRLAATPPAAPGETRPPPVRQIRDAHVTGIVLAYAKAIANLRPVDPSVLVAYVFEKPEPMEVTHRSGTIVKDGIHVLFPRVVTKSPTQFYLREKVLPLMSAALDGLPLTNAMGDVLDDKIIELANWQLYGSRKPGCKAYALTRVLRYDAGSDELVPLPLPEPFALATVKLLATRGRTQADATEFVEGPALAEMREWVHRIYPTVANRKRSALNNQVFATARNRTTNQVSDEDFLIVRKLVLNCLSKERAESYDAWVRVGWALRNVDHRLLDTWVEFSKLSSKFVEGECEKRWERMRQDGTLTINSIRYWARLDSPREFNKVLDDSLDILISRCVKSKGAHWDVAKVVAYMYNDQYVSCGKKRWWFYNAHRHRWQISSEGTMIRKALSTDVCSKFTAFHDTHIRKLQASDTERAVSERDAGVTAEGSAATGQDETSKVLLQIALKLKESGYKSSVIIEAESILNDEKFEDKLDSKTHLMGFNNGVYDFVLHEFRDGQPDDYISFSTGINYVPYDPNHRVVHEVNNFFRTVHRKPAVEKFQWDILAAALDGTAKSEKFYIMTGSGSNAKSKLTELVQKAFGDYACVLPVTVLTGKRVGTGGVSPELARIKGKRFVISQEPGDNEKLNISVMKEITGGDEITARSLYQNTMQFKPQCKLFLTCNELPTVGGVDDGGTWRRIRLINFESKFVLNPNPDNPNELPLDPDLVDKLPLWAETFMAMLVNHHANINPGKIFEPPEVTLATDKYKRSNDLLGQFVDETIKVDAASKKPLGIMVLYKELKTWWTSMSKAGCPSMPVVKDLLTRKFGPYGERGWKQLRFTPPSKAEEEDEDEDEDDGEGGSG